MVAPLDDAHRSRVRGREIGLIAGFSGAASTRALEAHGRRRPGAPDGDHRGRGAARPRAPLTLSLMIVIGFVFTPIMARTVRGAVLSERELEYVQAARLRGERART